MCFYESVSILSVLCQCVCILSHLVLYLVTSLYTFTLCVNIYVYSTSVLFRCCWCLSLSHCSLRSFLSALCWSEDLLRWRWNPAEINTTAVITRGQQRAGTEGGGVEVRGITCDLWKYSIMCKHRLTLWYSTTSSTKSIPSARGIRTPRFVQSENTHQQLLLSPQ